MNSNQQLSDYIFYYPEAMDSKTCNDIIKHFDIGAKWKQSTFSTTSSNTGTSKVSMEEYWIGSPLPYYKDIEKIVSDSKKSNPFFTDSALVAPPSMKWNLGWSCISLWY